MSLEFRGLLDMLVACLLFSAMSLCVFALSRDPEPVDAPVVGLIRVSVNLVLVLMHALPRGECRLLWGDMRPALWLRGFFGGASLLLSFLSIERIGPGESGFLTATSGLFIAILSPMLTGHSQKLLDWVAISGGLIGLYLLMQPGSGSEDLSGRWMGLCSGFLAALAYLMVSRSARSNPPLTVVFYFCLLALLIHFLWLTQTALGWPKNPRHFLMAVGAGLLGSLAQFFLTRAYQRASAVRVSAIGYLAPLLSLGLSSWVFGIRPGQEALVGSAMILLAGVLLPLVVELRAARKAGDQGPSPRQ